MTEEEPSIIQLDVGRWLPMVSEDRQQRTKKLYRLEDQWRSLAGEMLVRHVFRNCLGVQKEPIIFSRDAKGKPVSNTGIHYNVSHSGRWVCAAFDELPVGIDIEQITEADLDIAAAMFAPVEYEALLGMPEELRANFFFQLWTGKESYTKALGEGLMMPLDSFYIQSGNDYSRIVSAQQGETGWHIRHYDLDPSYAVTACGEAGRLPERMTTLLELN